MLHEIIEKYEISKNCGGWSSMENTGWKLIGLILIQ